MADIGEPNLTQLIEEAMDLAGEDVRVCLPGIVTGVDMQTARISVQPAIRRQASTDFEPVLSDIPVVFSQTAKARVSFPIEVGDQVLLVFSDRSLDNWLKHGGGQRVIPDDARSHDISDAFAIPLNVSEGVPSNRIDEFSVSFEGAEIRLQSNATAIVDGNTVKLGENASESIIKGDKFTSEFSTFLNAWSTALSGASTFSIYQAFASAISSFETQLSGWKSSKSKTE